MLKRISDVVRTGTFRFVVVVVGMLETEPMACFMDQRLGAVRARLLERYSGYSIELDNACIVLLTRVEAIAYDVNKK